jgi:hypothetical protein
MRYSDQLYVLLYRTSSQNILCSIIPSSLIQEAICYLISTDITSEKLWEIFLDSVMRDYRSTPSRLSISLMMRYSNILDCKLLTSKRCSRTRLPEMQIWQPISMSWTEPYIYTELMGLTIIGNISEIVSLFALKYFHQSENIKLNISTIDMITRHILT